MTPDPIVGHWLNKHTATKEKAAAVLGLAEKVGDDGAWTSSVVSWLARELMVALEERDALGERLMKELGAAQ